MSSASEPVIQTCTACGTLIDVSDEEPFASIHCPACGNAQRVRRTFDHFELQEELGAGGMGTVYRALDTSLNRPVALKLLRKEYSADQEFVQQFEKEAAVTASINHPNVVKVFTAGQDHGLVYIVMELVDKGSLDDLITLQGRVAEAQALEVGIQIAKGLNAAWQRGLIHRDVKPGNILFADAHLAKIVDFGLAVLQEHASTVAGEVWGTPYYVAPEKLDNQPEDLRSDLYSLGATLFHAVAGRPPFEAETASMVALKHIKSQAVSLQAFAPDVSSATAYVINKTLAKDPKDRYQTYEELVEHLEYARNKLLIAPPRSPAQKARVVVEDEGTTKVMSWVTFGMIAAIVAGGVYLYVNRDSGKGKAVKRDPEAEKARVRAETIETQFIKATELLTAGQLEEATKTLDELEAQPNVPQPLLNWITLHRGLALLLASREAEARTIFEKIVERGVYSHDPSEEKMSNFFIDTAKKLTEQFPVQKTLASALDKENYESIALLCYALKNWGMGKFDDGTALFRQFHSSSPKSPYEWINGYRSLATVYIDAYRHYDEVARKLRAANTVDEMKDAVAEAKEVRGKLQDKDKLTLLLDETIKHLEEKIVRTEKDEIDKMAKGKADDAKAIEELRTQATVLIQQLKFGDARALANAVSVSGADAKREQAAWVRKAEWLVKFKATLIADLNATGYAQPILRKTGQAIPGAAMRANELGVEVRTPYSSTPVVWTDLSLDTLFNMGRAFIRPGLPAEAVADRQWMCGVFGLVFNKPREGRELLTAAAEAKAEYKEELPRLLESSATP